MYEEINRIDKNILNLENNIFEILGKIEDNVAFLDKICIDYIVERTMWMGVMREKIREKVKINVKTTKS